MNDIDRKIKAVRKIVKIQEEQLENNKKYLNRLKFEKAFESMTRNSLYGVFRIPSSMLNGKIGCTATKISCKQFLGRQKRLSKS